MTPTDPRALIRQGDDLKAAGDNARAIVAYSSAVKVDPALAEAYNKRGEAWRANGDRLRALADFTAALKLDPQFEAARANRRSLATEIERLGAQMPLKPK
jgi:tetratricopeptide (TPR) repeat protein